MRSSLLAVPFLLAGASVALAQPGKQLHWDQKRGIQSQKDAADEAEKAVKGSPDAETIRQALGDTSGYVRDEVCQVLAQSSAGDEALVTLAKALPKLDPLVGGQVAELIGGKRLAAAREHLEKALAKVKPQAGTEAELMLAEVAWALGEIGDAGSIPALEKALKTHGKKNRRAGHYPARVAAEAALALARCDADQAVQRLATGVTESDRASVRIACLLDLVERDPRRALELALAQLDPKELKKQEEGWGERVQFAAHKVFRGIHKRSDHGELYEQVLVLLIEGLEDADGRLEHEMELSLSTIVGQRLVGGASAWRDWLEAFKARDEPFVPHDGPLAEVEEGATRVRSSFFGIPLYSNRIIFVLDASGGMKRPRQEDGPARMVEARDALQATITALAKRAKKQDVRIDTLFFASDFFARDDLNLIPLRKGAMVKQLVEFVTGMEIPTKVHTNRGNMYDPLHYAMQRPDVDTIILLSEGNPTEGRFNDRGRFVRHMMRTAKLTQTQVDALYFGSPKTTSAKKYLYAVATPTGGGLYLPDAQGKQDYSDKKKKKKDDKKKD